MFEGNLIDHTAWDPRETYGNERIYITETGYTMLQEWRTGNQQQQLTNKQAKLSRLTVRLTAVLAITAIVQALASILSINGQTVVVISESYSAVIPYRWLLFSFYLILGLVFLGIMKKDQLL